MTARSSGVSGSGLRRMWSGIAVLPTSCIALARRSSSASSALRPAARASFGSGTRSARCARGLLVARLDGLPRRGGRRVADGVRFRRSGREERERECRPEGTAKWRTRHSRLRPGADAPEVGSTSVRAVCRVCEHVFALIVCVQIPRFELAVAAGGRETLASGPVALAPEAGREQLIGEVSAAAEAHGVRAGLRLGEALARCPTLRLVPPDPAGVADEWERLTIALEGIGAAVEPGRPGLAFFDAQGLKTIHGGSLEGVVAAARRALAVPVRVGAAPSRFAALAAASAARPRRAEIAPTAPAALRAYLAPLPVRLLILREETAALPDVVERFGIRTLG